MGKGKKKNQPGSSGDGQGQGPQQVLQPQRQTQQRPSQQQPPLPGPGGDVPSSSYAKKMGAPPETSPSTSSEPTTPIVGPGGDTPAIAGQKSKKRGGRGGKKQRAEEKQTLPEPTQAAAPQRGALPQNQPMVPPQTQPPPQSAPWQQQQQPLAPQTQPTPQRAPWQQQQQPLAPQTQPTPQRDPWPQQQPQTQPPQRGPWPQQQPQTQPTPQRGVWPQQQQTLAPQTQPPQRGAWQQYPQRAARPQQQQQQTLPSPRGAWQQHQRTPSPMDQQHFFGLIQKLQLSEEPASQTSSSSQQSSLPTQRTSGAPVASPPGFGAEPRQKSPWLQPEQEQKQVSTEKQVSQELKEEDQSGQKKKRRKGKQASSEQIGKSVEAKVAPPELKKEVPALSQTTASGSQIVETTQTSKVAALPLLKGRGNALANVATRQPGIKGRKIIVETNHISLDVGKLEKAIHYDVAINPDIPRYLMRPVMAMFQKKHYPQYHPAFDGRKNLYSARQLPFGEFINDKVEVENENGRAKEFEVQVKFANYVDLTPLRDMFKCKSTPQEAIQCLDIVLRSAPLKQCITAGRSFFTRPRDTIIDLGDGMEMYYGFYQSAIRGWKAFLNIDVAHKAFPKAQSVLDLIMELGRIRPQQLGYELDPRVKDTVDRYIRKLKIKYEIPRKVGSQRIYTVNGLDKPANKASFKNDKGQVMTVAQYYESEKKERLKYPNLPTVWVGSQQKKILIACEFCSILENQTIQRKMNEYQTSNMIKQAATSTVRRKEKIMTALHQSNYNANPSIREFGFSVGNNFEKLEARVLDPPELSYVNNSVARVSRGVWRLQRGFYKGATINRWTIVNFDRAPIGMEKLADMIFQNAGRNGIQMISKAQQPFYSKRDLREIKTFLQDNKHMDLIIVVIPNAGPNYAILKKEAELHVGCLTQCIKRRTVDRLSPATVDNILLKINSKLNGTNHILRNRPTVMNVPCMLMGADVTHPSPDARNIPSVAAVTASHDPQGYYGYNICWRLQPPKMEIIEDLENITFEQLMYFYRRNNQQKPQKIIMLRDGVSEGQFEQVQNAEIRAIQRACKRIQKDGFEPPITFVVVQKRHHTRLFPRKEDSEDPKNLNVPAGTCVDTHITNPTMQDFYLVSHASIQGVAKPTKYCTLWDDNSLSNDDMESLVYHLCHMFARCTRSVSYPAPTYYAHLAAARAKVYIEQENLDMKRLKEAQDRFKILDCIVKEKPMFFV